MDVNEIKDLALTSAFERLEAIIVELAGHDYRVTPPVVELFVTKFYALTELPGPAPCKAPVRGHVPRDVRAGDDELLTAALELLRIGELALSWKTDESRWLLS